MKRLLSMLLAVMLVFATVGFATPAPVTTVDDSAETAQTVNEQDNALTEVQAVLLSDDEWTHDDYGTLLYEIDFENSTSFTSEDAISKHGKVNPNFDNTDNWVIKNSSSTLKGLVTEGDNTYLAITNTTSKYPQVVTECTSGVFAGENGYYTIIADVYHDVKGENITSFAYNSRYQYYLSGDDTMYRNDKNNSQVERGKLATTHNTSNPGTWTDGVWETVVGQYNVTSLSGQSGSSVDGIYLVIHTFNLSASSASNGIDTYAVDNLKMYWKPFDIQVTVLGGDNTVAGDNVFSAPLAQTGKTTFTKRELMDSVLDWGDKLLVDLTLEDGTPFETITTNEDLVLKAVWEDYVKTDRSLDFNSEDQADGIIWCSKGQVDSNPITPADGEAAGSGYKNNNDITYNGTYLTLKHDVVDSNGNEVETGIYDANWSLAAAKGGSCKMPISDIGAVQIRMRARNTKAESEKYVYRVNNASNGTREYVPNFTMDLFFALDTGDGTTFNGLNSKRQTQIMPSTSYKKLNSDWFTIYCDLTELTGLEYTDGAFVTGTSTEYWNDALYLRQLRIDPTDSLWAGTEFDIDYIHFIERENLVKYEAEAYFLNNGEKTVITGDMSDVDYRYNSVLCYEFDKDIGYTAEQFYDLLVANGMTDGIYNAHMEYDEATNLYTYYAGSNLMGTEVELAGCILLKDEDGTRTKLTSTSDSAVITFSDKKTFDDGENLIPNGEFTVPYYDSFTDIHNVYTSSVDADNTRLEVVFEKSTFNGYATYRNNSIVFEANKKYYVDVSVQFAGVKNESGVIDDSYTVNKSSLNYWMPYDDGKYGFSNTPYWSAANKYNYFPEGTLPAELPNATFALNSGNKNDQRKVGVFELKTEETRGSYISFQANIIGSNGKSEAIVTKQNTDGTTTNLITVSADSTSLVTTGEEKGFNGVTYYLNHLIVKEMFEVDFVDTNGNVMETRYAAKDIGIYLPETTMTSDGSVIIGWTDGENTYELGDFYPMATAGNKTITAVVEEGTSKVPAAYNQYTIRYTDPMGVRFKASVTNEQKSVADSYGYVVAKKSALDAAGIECTEFTLDSSVKKASGEAYVKGTDVDKIFDMDESNVFFTAVLYNIPESAYSDVIVVRPYVAIGENEFYGAPMQASIYQVAKSIADNGYDGLDVVAKIAVDKIIETVEKA